MEKLQREQLDYFLYIFDSSIRDLWGNYVTLLQYVSIGFYLKPIHHCDYLLDAVAAIA